MPGVVTVVVPLVSVPMLLVTSMPLALLPEEDKPDKGCGQRRGINVQRSATGSVNGAHSVDGDGGWCPDSEVIGEQAPSTRSGDVQTRDLERSIVIVQ